MLNLPRTTRWWGELLGADGQPIGSDLPLWASVKEHPGYAAASAWLDKQDVPQAERPERVKALLTSSLLPDLVHAASGVERAIALLQRHTAETQRWVDEVLKPKYRRPEVGSRVHAQEVLSASLALSDSVAWVRAFLDRIDRGVPGRRYRVGLMPALASGPLCDRVTSAHELLERELGDVRKLANYTIHHSALPYAGAPADIDEEWRVSLMVPNPPKPDVYAPELLTYHGCPTAGHYTTALLDAVSKFMDETIAAFKESTGGSGSA